MPWTATRSEGNAPLLPQSVESGNARAKERAGFHGVETLRHCGEGFHGSDHVFLIAAIKADSANFSGCGN